MGACAGGIALIWRARYSASSLTQPSSAEPRVCCHGRPRTYRPGDAVTPRLCMRWPVGVEDRGVDPRVVEFEAGGPDDGARLKPRAVAEGYFGARYADGPPTELDALPASGGAGA